MIRIKKFVCVTLFFALVSPGAAFAQEKAMAVTKPLIRLAVLPFHAVWPEENSTTARCPICGSVNSGGSISKGAEKILEELFTDKLRDLKNTEIIIPEKAAGIYKRVLADSLKKPVLQIIRKTGSELGADVLVVGYLYHYRERVGYDYSAERPASVSFEIHLISVKDGGMLWRGIFDKTQKSLMEDVFQASSFFKGGAKWLTARELTKLGVDEIFATFPGFEP
jgi:hypothetical protein